MGDIRTAGDAHDPRIGIGDAFATLSQSADACWRPGPRSFQVVEAVTGSDGTLTLQQRAWPAAACASGCLESPLRSAVNINVIVHKRWTCRKTKTPFHHPSSDHASLTPPTSFPPFPLFSPACRYRPRIASCSLRIPDLGPRAQSLATNQQKINYRLPHGPRTEVNNGGRAQAARRRGAGPDCSPIWPGEARPGGAGPPDRLACHLLLDRRHCVCPSTRNIPAHRRMICVNS